MTGGAEAVGAAGAAGVTSCFAQAKRRKGRATSKAMRFMARIVMVALRAFSVVGWMRFARCPTRSRSVSAEESRQTRHRERAKRNQPTTDNARSAITAGAQFVIHRICAEGGASS